MIHLILGGARSGKSSFAEMEALKLSEKITYVATATPDDAEMKQRIAHHQSRRSGQWQLIEEPFFLSKVLAVKKPSDQLVKAHKVLLIDCMTLWVSNWLCKKPQDPQNSFWKKEKRSFLASLEKSEATIIIVSNELGSGIVPLGELSREFVDRAGWLNQAIASISNKVTLVVAGLPLTLKEQTSAISGVSKDRNLTK